jgi:hypothetical protein
MTGVGLLRAQLCQSNSAFWWAVKLTGIAIMYIAIFTIPRPQSAVSVEHGICSKSEAQFVCSCLRKPTVSASVGTPKVGPE